MTPVQEITTVKEWNRVTSYHSLWRTYPKTGRYFKQDGKIWLAFDNRTNDGWLEEFKTKEEAIAWLEQ